MAPLLISQEKLKSIDTNLEFSSPLPTTISPEKEKTNIQFNQLTSPILNKTRSISGNNDQIMNIIPPTMNNTEMISTLPQSNFCPSLTSSQQIDFNSLEWDTSQDALFLTAENMTDSSLNETLRGTSDNSLDSSNLNLSILQTSRSNDGPVDGDRLYRCCQQKICSCSLFENLTVNFVISLNSVIDKNSIVIRSSIKPLCKLILDHLYSLELKQLYRLENVVSIKIMDINSKTNTFHLKVRTNTNNFRDVDIKITDDLVIFSSKARAYAGEDDIQTNAAIILYDTLIYTPLSRTYNQMPHDDTHVCRSCDQRLMNKRGKTVSTKCKLCLSTIHKDCAGSLNTCRHGCKETSSEWAAPRKDFNKKGELQTTKVKSKLPKWILIKENPSKPKDLISKLKPAEIKKKTPVKLVKKGRALGENSFFTTKKIQPLISDTIGTNTRKRQLHNGSSANSSDSHFVSTIPVLVEESENENDTQESQRKKQKKKRSVKNVPTEETPTLTDSDNSDYNSDSEDETELSEEQLYRKAEREGIKIPKYFRSRLSLYRKERDEFVNRCKKEQEKIDKMKSISNEQKAKLSKDAMFKSLQSAAGIVKEQLDASMHARVQLENHIF